VAHPRRAGWANHPAGRAALAFITLWTLGGIVSAAFFVDSESPGVTLVAIAIMLLGLLAVLIFAWKTGRSS
jgi:hypothetical protein